MKLDASLARKSAGGTISSGAAMRGISWAVTIPCCTGSGLLRTMSVSTVPGARALTRMPSAANSAAIVRVICRSAALAATYIDTNVPWVNAPALITLTTAACPLARRWGSASCTRNTGPRRLASNDFAHASAVIEPSGRASALAALFTTTSTPPNAATVVPTSAARPSRSPTWVGTASAVPPAAAISVAPASQASALRLATTTLAPMAARPLATARPIPRLPPVTMATRGAMSTRPRSARRSIGRSARHGVVGEDGVDLVEVVVGELPGDGGHVRPDLLGRRGPGDHGTHGRLGGQPGEGQVEDGVAVVAGPGGERVDQVEVVVGHHPVDPLAGHARQAGAVGRRFPAVVLAGEQAIGQREVGQHHQPVALAGGDHPAQRRPLQQVELVLGGDEPGQVVALRDLGGLVDHPPREVAVADLADLALPDQGVE